METEVTYQPQEKAKEIVQKKRNTQPKAEDKSVEWQRQRDREIVRGKFMNLEQPGAPLEFVYKAYKGDPVEKYEFQHGGVYDVPLGVADHINNNCSTPVYEHISLPSTKSGGISGHNPDKRNAMKVTGTVARFSFSPLNFSKSDFLGNTHNRILKVESMETI